MAKAKVKTNMFELLSQMKKNLEQLNGILDVKDFEDCNRFVLRFESYVESAQWTNNDVDKKIIALAVGGYSSGKIKKILSLPEGTFRVKVMRMTSKLYSQLFEDGKCPEELYQFTDIQLVKWYSQKISYLDRQFSLVDELNPEIIMLINDFCSGVLPKVPDDIASVDVFNAIEFVALLTKDVINEKLNLLNPEALAFVMSELNKSEFSETFFYFKAISGTLKKTQITSDKARNLKLKEAYLSLCGNHGTK